MALEHGLYAQVSIIHRRGLDDKKEKYEKYIYNFQGQSARSRRWFDLDHECLKEKFRTR